MVNVMWAIKKWPYFEPYFSYFNFIFGLTARKKFFNGTLFINFNFLPNIDAIWVLISLPADVRSVVFLSRIHKWMCDKKTTEPQRTSAGRLSFNKFIRAKRAVYTSSVHQASVVDLLLLGISQPITIIKCNGPFLFQELLVLMARVTLDAKFTSHCLLTQSTHKLVHIFSTLLWQ